MCKGRCRLSPTGAKGRIGVIVVAFGLLAVWLPTSASAGPARYVFEMCDSALPGGGDAGVQFAVNPGVPFSPSNNCSVPGGSLAINQTGPVSATYAFWSLPIAPPPGGTIESVTVTAAKCSSGGGTVAFVFSSGWPPNCAGEQRTIFQLDAAFGIFWIWLGCDGNYPGGCGAGPWISAHYFAATEVDPVAPTLTDLRGSLLAGGMIRGNQTVGVDVHDVGGGISNVAVSVNGLPAAQPRVTNCNVAFADNPSVKGIVAAAITPCPIDAGADWMLDTESYPFHDGANTVRVCASDFSTLNEPNTTCSAAQTVNVDNSCTGSEVGGGEVLSAQFAESNADTVTVGYGKGAAVAGRLADDAGDPVSGATLCVKAQTLGLDSRAFGVGTVKTDAQGRYSYQVPPGPNREIVIGYRHDARQVARDVRYYAHAQPTLRRAPRKLTNGKRVRLWGSLPGPNAGGRVVVLQANVPGSKRWLTFRRATTDPNGAFRSRYRFSSTTRRITYRFRAVVPNQAGYPWLEGSSAPVKVRVRPKR